MTGNNLNVEKTAPVTSATPAPAVNIIPNTGDTIDSLTLLKMVNEARKLCGEQRFGTTNSSKKYSTN